MCIIGKYRIVLYWKVVNEKRVNGNESHRFIGNITYADKFKMTSYTYPYMYWKKVRIW